MEVEVAQIFNGRYELGRRLLAVEFKIVRSCPILNVSNVRRQESSTCSFSHWFFHAGIDERSWQICDHVRCTQVRYPNDDIVLLW